MKFRTESVTRSPVSAYLPHGVLALGIAVIGLCMASVSRGWRLPSTASAATQATLKPPGSAAVDVVGWPSRGSEIPIRAGDWWADRFSDPRTVVTYFDMSGCSHAGGLSVAMFNFGLKRMVVYVPADKFEDRGDALRVPELDVRPLREDVPSQRLARQRQVIVVSQTGVVAYASRPNASLPHELRAQVRHGEHHE